MNDLKVGKKIRNLRIGLDLTMEDLADRCELSKGYISQLEREKTSVSLETLFDICEALGTDLSEFFKEDKEEKIVFGDKDRNTLEEDEYKITWLVPNAQKMDMEPIMIDINPGKDSEILKPFEGETFGYVIDGEIILSYGTEEEKVSQGESFYTPCNKDIVLKNKTSKIAKVIWVVSPPQF